MESATLVLVWAQAPVSSTTTPFLVALKRWCYGLTLCSPDPQPSVGDLLRVAGALIILAVIAASVQGLGVMTRQLLGLQTLWLVWKASAGRLLRASRLIITAVSFTVLSWTLGEMALVNRGAGAEDLMLVQRTRTRLEISVEQGLLAALTPLRDVAGLADNLPWMLLAAYLVFRASNMPADEDPHWASAGGPIGAGSRPPFTSLVWGGAAVYAFYRLVAWGSAGIELPRGSILVVETVLVPLAMLVVDGYLLAWLLVELRESRPDRIAPGRFQPLQAVALLPASALACLAALPARYVAIFVLLGSTYLPSTVASSPLGEAIRSIVGRGLIDLQLCLLWAVPVAGVAAFSRGSLVDCWTGFRRLIVEQGGRVLAIMIASCAASALVSAAAYAVVLLLPTRSWVLHAADAYAHFATLPIALFTLSVLVELAERSLPVAALDAQPADAAAENALLSSS